MKHAKSRVWQKPNTGHQPYKVIYGSASIRLWGVWRKLMVKLKELNVDDDTQKLWLHPTELLFTEMIWDVVF